MKKQVLLPTFYHTCTVCGSQESSERRLKEHVNTAHEGITQLKFRQQSLESVSIIESGSDGLTLKRHLKPVLKEAKHACHLCDYKATERENLRRHRVTVHVNSTLPCNICHYKAVDKTELKKHFQSSHTGVKYFCSKCHYQTTMKTELAKHKKAVHDDTIKRRLFGL